MTGNALLIAAFGLAFAQLTFAQTVYTRQHDILAQTIRTGHAEGELTGPAADLFTKQFNSTGPLLVTAKVIEILPRPDCKRIQMVYTKKNVTGPQGTQDVVMNTELNYCLDGRAPQ
jgi:hypothetical protein